MKPSPEMIIRILTDMADPDFECPSASGLWYVSAYDTSGRHHSIGAGITLEEAAAGAWVNACLPDEVLSGGRLNIRQHLTDVPHVVPDDWTFVIDDFPATGAA